VMGRRGYLYISGSDEKISMFKEFLKIKNLTQREVSELYMDAVMISIDKNLFFELKKKWLKIDEINDYVNYKKERGNFNEGL